MPGWTGHGGARGQRGSALLDRAARREGDCTGPKCRGAGGALPALRARHGGLGMQGWMFIPGARSAER